MARRGPLLPWGRIGAGRDAGILSPGRGRSAGGCRDTRRAGFALRGGSCGVWWHATAPGGEVMAR